MTRPEIASILHADFSPVTSDNPARAGETLVLRVTGLGGTKPGVDPGKPFPMDALQAVFSPVDVIVGGRPADVMNKIGWPGATDVYRVDIRIPSGIPPGAVTMQISSAFIPGPAVQIQVR